MNTIIGVIIACIGFLIGIILYREWLIRRIRKRIMRDFVINNKQTFDARIQKMGVYELLMVLAWVTDKEIPGKLGEILTKKEQAD